MHQLGTWAYPLGYPDEHRQGINCWHCRPTASAWRLGMSRECCFKLNAMSPYFAFPTQTLALNQEKHIPTDHYIFDSRATDACYKPSITIACTLLGAHCIIKAIQPYGSTLSSMEKMSISLPHTSLAIQRSTDRRILLTLKDHSILSMRQSYDAWCTITFTAKEALILLNGEVVLRRVRCKNNLWYLNTKAFNTSIQSQAYMQQKESNMKLNSCMWPFSPPKATLLSEIKAGFLSSWPLLIADNITKYLTEMPTTHKGHLNCIWQNTWSTKTNQPHQEDPILKNGNTFHICLFLETKSKQRLRYSNLTRHFPQTSASGNWYILVFYSWEANAIFMELMWNRNNFSVQKGVWNT